LSCDEIFDVLAFASGFNHELSKKVLAENLRKLQSAGLIVRNDLSSHILHVEYDLAEPAKAATYQLLDQLARWGDKYEAFNSKQE
jgi:DNA-binding HxlR family transcriptional regulator